MDFLSLDECLALQAEGKLVKKNHGRDEPIVFEQSYFKSGFSGSIRIARTDKEDFHTKFDKNAFDLICPAVPKDFLSKLNEKYEERKPKVVITTLPPDVALVHMYDCVSPDALLFGAESFSESDFLNHTLSKEMWKMSVKPKCITGWAWYSKVMKTQSSSKNKVIPVKVRPLVDDEENKKLNIYNYVYFSNAYLKSDFPQLEHLTDYKIKRMTEHKLASTIMELLEGSSKFGNTVIWKGGASKKKLFIYYNVNEEEKVLEFSKMVESNAPADFNFEDYLIDDGTRLIVDSPKFERMKAAYINHIKLLNNGGQ